MGRDEDGVGGSRSRIQSVICNQRERRGKGVRMR